jgi:putative transposase
LYQWRDQYDGMETSDSTCFKQLETENRKLKQMLAKLSLKAQLQEQIINKLVSTHAGKAWVVQLQ